MAQRIAPRINSGIAKPSMTQFDLISLSFTHGRYQHTAVAVVTVSSHHTGHHLRHSVLALAMLWAMLKVDSDVRST